MVHLKMLGYSHKFRNKYTSCNLYSICSIIDILLLEIVIFQRLYKMCLHQHMKSSSELNENTASYFSFVGL